MAWTNSGPVSRITALFGARPGAAALVGSAIEAATAFDVPLRLLALIENDGMAEDEVAVGNLDRARDAYVLTDAGRLLADGVIRRVLWG